MLIYGVDFSGAKDAGKKIWISCASISQYKLVIGDLSSVKNFFNTTKWRGDAYSKLRNFIKHKSDGIFGFDFPFGLPKLINDYIRTQIWDDFVSSFSKNFHSAEQFRNECKERFQCELRRKTDTISGTPFSPYNLRLYKQTYYGIVDIISPLTEADNICIMPMQKQKYRKENKLLIEICPASTLIKEDSYCIPYKKNTDEAYNNRLRIIGHLESRGINFASPKIRSTVLDDYRGDALDSIIAAYATFKAYKNNFKTSNQELEEYFKLEGYVYS